MAGVLRSQFTEQMKKDMYGYFWESFPDKPMVYTALFEVVPSDAAYEKFSSAIGLGELLEKPEGEDLQADAPMESYTIVCKNRSFGRLVRFSYETVKDAQKTSNIVATTVGTWGRKIPVTKEKFYAKFFNKGAFTAGHDVFNGTISGGVVDDPSGAKIYDGQPFFSTAHPDKVGNTYSNFGSATTLTAANLRTVYETFTITNNRDERADIIDLMPDTLLINPALKFTAQEILQTEKVPGSFDNDINVLMNIVTPLSWSYIDGSDDWALGNRGMGLMATEREDVNLDFWQDETSKDYYASIFTRFGGAVTQWRHWYGCAFSTS